MYDYNYEEIYNYILEVIKREDLHPREVLEMAAGTGNLTEYLRKSFKVTAFDISEEMLSMAYEKLRKYKNVHLMKADLREFYFNKTYPIILCLCDSLNYLLKEEEIYTSLRKSYDHLEKGGILLFDLNSKHYFKNVLGQKTFSDETRGNYYVWNNNYEEETSLNYYDVDFFVNIEDNLYERFSETHIERGYDNNFVIAALEDIGFCNISTFNGYTFSENIKDANRIVYLAKK